MLKPPVTPEGHNMNDTLDTLHVRKDQLVEDGAFDKWPLYRARNPVFSEHWKDRKPRRCDKLGAEFKFGQAIGRGSFGVVCELAGSDPVYGNALVVKVIVAEAEDPEVYFGDTLVHPNILRLLDYSRTEDVQYLVYQRFPGSLHDLIHHSRYTTELTRVSVLLDVALALEHIHGKGVVHCDMKPQNVLVHGNHAVVSDFGLANDIGKNPGFVGYRDIVSEGYRAPEIQWRIFAETPEQIRRNPWTTALDVFAFGCIAFEVFFNRRLFVAEGAHHMDAIMDNYYEDDEADRLKLPGYLLSNTYRLVEKKYDQNMPPEIRGMFGAMSRPHESKGALDFTSLWANGTLAFLAKLTDLYQTKRPTASVAAMFFRKWLNELGRGGSRVVHHTPDYHVGHTF